MNLSNEQTIQLREKGYLHIAEALTSAETEAICAKLETLWEQEGAEAGAENYKEPNTRRLANLSDKGAIFRPLYTDSRVLDACRQIMGPDVRVSMLNARDALPNSGARQMWHCDTDNSGIPDDSGYYACTAIWMLDDFTPDNGATYLVPGSHLSGKVPKMVMEDRYAPHPDEIRALGKRGDLFIFNGHCFHAGGANTTDGSRRALLVHFLRADWLPERQDRRQVLSAETIAELSQAELTLLDY